jgi:hypothetical protein
METRLYFAVCGASVACSSRTRAADLRERRAWHGERETQHAPAIAAFVERRITKIGVANETPRGHHAQGPALR